MRVSIRCLLATAVSVVGLVGSNLGAGEPVKIIFDTDIEADVDDVGSVAVLHALANRGEAEILAMGVSAKNPWCAPCLDALNTYFGRPDIPIGVVKGLGAEHPSNYCQKVAEEFPHKLKSTADAPDAVTVYRKVLAKQPDQSVVIVTVGFLTNLANLLRSDGDEFSSLNGKDLVKQKIKTWVCMGAQHPTGKEWNIIRDAKSSVEVGKNWPTPIVWSGFEIGVVIETGAGLSVLPKTSPVRRGYELYNGLKNRSSWDQTAVLYAVRGLNGGLKEFWDVGTGGRFEFAADGTNKWVADEKSTQSYLIKKMPPAEVAKHIEALMLEQPKK